MDTTFKEFAIPKLGEVKPVDIFSLERRKFDEKTVTDLIEALRRDGGFLHPPAVRDEGEGRCRLIHGHHRVEAWKRCCGEQTPMPANVYPSDTPDALIAILEYEENLLRKELTPAEREAQTIRLAAALKKLTGEMPVTPVSESGEAAETGNLIPSLPPARGGRGNKGVAQQVAEKLGIGKRAVNMRRTSAAAAIGEEIDFDGDTPEELERKAAELERKADRRQHAAGKIVLKRRKPALCVEDPTLAEPQAGEFDSQIEPWLKAFDRFGETCQFRAAYLVCVRLGLDPLKMAPAAVFGLANEESELAEDLPAEIPAATDDEQAEHGDEAVVAHAEQGDDAAVAQAEDEDAPDLGAEHLQDAGDDVPDAADPEIGVTKCAHCKEPFLSSNPPRKKYGRLYHRKNCVNHAKPITIAA